MRFNAPATSGCHVQNVHLQVQNSFPIFNSLLLSYKPTQWRSYLLLTNSYTIREVVHQYGSRMIFLTIFVYCSHPLLSEVARFNYGSKETGYIFLLPSTRYRYKTPLQNTVIPVLTDHKPRAIGMPRLGINAQIILGCYKAKHNKAQLIHGSHRMSNRK